MDFVVLGQFNSIILYYTQYMNKHAYMRNVNIYKSYITVQIIHEKHTYRQSNVIQIGGDRQSR